MPDTTTDYADTLYRKIESRAANVAISGLGYVGLPLAVEFAHAGFNVTGIDLDERKTETINSGRSYIKDVADEAVRTAVESGRLRAVTDYSALRDADTISICVPTPLRKTKDPDISYIVAATESIAANFRPGQPVALESTTNPGPTAEILQPPLRAAAN